MAASKPTRANDTQPLLALWNKWQGVCHVITKPLRPSRSGGGDELTVLRYAGGLHREWTPQPDQPNWHGVRRGLRLSHLAPFFQGVFDALVKGRLGVDHRPKCRDRDLAVHR